jgi:hypothetical protein
MTYRLQIPTRQAVHRALARARIPLASLPPEPKHGTLAWLRWADEMLWLAHSRCRSFAPPPSARITAK